MKNFSLSKKLEQVVLFLLLLASLYFSIGSLSNNFYWGFNFLLFKNSDFENGDLTSWEAQGSGFEYQPTFGDNTTFRGKSPANFRGSYWVGTCEKRHLPTDTKGRRELSLSGTLTSVPFKIIQNKISFLIGGPDNNTTSVNLEIEGNIVLTENAKSASKSKKDFMRRKTWDVSRWKGSSARIIIKDESTADSSYINVDDFRYSF